MGRDFALAAASRRAHLMLPMRNPDLSLVGELQQQGAMSVEVEQVDLSDIGAIDNYLNHLNEPVDLLINNAGLLSGGLLEEQDPQHIQDTLQVNVGSLIHLTRCLLPQMLKRKSGKIVNNASVSGVMFMPCASTYAASKAGVVAFTRSLEQELKGTGVSTLLLLTPGVKTDMYDQIYDEYGGHLDLSFLTHISSKAWSDRVFQAIDEDKNECGPSSMPNKIGLWLAQHWPSAFNHFIRKGFRR